MKKLFLFLLPALVFAFLPQATAQEASEAPETIVTGEITNPANDKVAISNRAESYKADLVDGKFEIKFHAEEGGRYRFAHGDEVATIYLDPGDQVHLTIDPSQFDETIKLTGKGASESNYLFSKYLLDEQLWEDRKAIISLDPTAYMAKVNGIHETLMANFKKHLKQDPDINQEFMKDEKLDLIYSTASNKAMYPMYHEYLTKNKVEVADDYLDFAKDLSLNDENMKGNYTYSQFVNSYLHVKARQELKARGKESFGYDYTPDLLKSKYALISDKITDEGAKNKMLFRELIGYLAMESPDGVEDLVQKFSASIDNEKQQKQLSAALETATRLAKGKAAPDFSYPNIEGTNMSLETFKGRFVYIDLWATWCGPCLQELPYLEALQEEYKGNRNIAFVSISIDSNKEAWRKMVTEDEMKGFQLIADNAWQSEICKAYGVNGIPRFILIDREGKLLNKNAPRPSSDDLKATLQSLLSDDRSSK